MADKYAIEGSLGLRLEALGGEQILKLRPEEIAQSIEAVTLLHTQLVTTIYELHEAREDISLLRERLDKLSSDNTSLREIKARYELVEGRGYLEMVLSALLGIGISQVMSAIRNPIGWTVLILSGLAILCSILPRLLRRKGGNK